MFRPLSAAELLHAWEQGLAQAPARRALILLGAACPDLSRDALARMSIGQRDARLLALREALFGSQVTGLTACPVCGDQLELAFAVADILAAPSAAESADTHMLAAAGCEVQFRLLNSEDLLAIANAVDIASARRALFARCVVQAHRDDEYTPIDQLPDEVVSAVAESMALLDPQAEVQLTLTCPVCANQWQAAFDIVSYLWAEINAWAMCLLREVHSLARAYGWREADILAMSAIRRHWYLEMIGRG
jgi:uncharacterized protein (UPF0212 family)